MTPYLKGEAISKALFLVSMLDFLGVRLSYIALIYQLLQEVRPNI